jgi:two-component system, chemotaxis family, CheB/CheR fusion protein
MGYGRDRGLKSTRILLVEDAEDIRDVFAMLLESEGAEVVAAATGAEAAEAAERQPFDIVLTDLGLPDIPGDSVIRHVLAKASRRPRVVVLTGYDEPFTSRARQAGADIVLNKPIAFPDLIDHLVRNDSEPDAVAA